MGASFFILSVKLGPSVQGEILSSQLWDKFSDGEKGITGIHEGTVLSEEAFQKGLETESFTVDAALAPRERDWVKEIPSDWVVYFGSSSGAANARAYLMTLDGVAVGEVEERATEDWDAQWKASFQGMDVPPFWVVRPPWNLKNIPSTGKLLQLNPGAGFGTGTHETTQLCLEQIAKRVKSTDVVLDFGSGSGILSIGAALMGAKVTGVEIDPLANENAYQNQDLNAANIPVKIHFHEYLPTGETDFDVVIANILRPVLIEFSGMMTSVMKPGATLILSGLVENDLPEIRATFSKALNSPAILESALNEWRCIVFQKPVLGNPSQFN